MKNCYSCEYRDRYITEEPCFSCKYTENWEPKEVADEDPGSDSKS